MDKDKNNKSPKRVPVSAGAAGTGTEPDKAADDAAGTRESLDSATLDRILTSYATVSGKRHGCPAP